MAFEVPSGAEIGIAVVRVAHGIVEARVGGELLLRVDTAKSMQFTAMTQGHVGVLFTLVQDGSVGIMTGAVDVTLRKADKTLLLTSLVLTNTTPSVGFSLTVRPAE